MKIKNQHVERNTPAHTSILARHMENNAALFSDFRAPDVLSTFTWGASHALEALFNPTKIAAHNLMLVPNKDVQNLIKDIEHTVLEYAPQPDEYVGLLNPNSAALCTAVWSSPSSHCLVAVASNLRHSWRSNSVPPFVFLSVGERWVHNTGILDSLEYDLWTGAPLPVGVFDALGSTAVNGAPQRRMEQMIYSWLQQTSLKNEKLVLNEFEMWKAAKQKQVLENEIETSAPLPRKRVL